MKPDHAQRLLDRIAVLRHPCDLDLLIFFARQTGINGLDAILSDAIRAAGAAREPRGKR